MATTGIFGAGFRTGKSSESQLELLLNTYLQARGDAITSDPGTVAYVEAVAVSRALYTFSEQVRRFGAQFDPASMSSYLDRWEAIFRTHPNGDLTVSERKQLIASKLQFVGLMPDNQLVVDILRAMLGTTFVELVHVPDNKVYQQIPGGLQVPSPISGVPSWSVPDGDWYSNFCYLPIRVSKPTNMTDGEFVSTVSSFLNLFYDLLPSYTDFNWGTFQVRPGVVSVAAGSTALTGINTSFLTDTDAIVPGDILELHDISGNVVDVTVATVNSNVSITLASPATTSVSYSPWATEGFILDSDVNTDCVFLG